MKVVVFSDVQGNLPAMEVPVKHILAWNPELVVMGGDLVNRGPSSAACLDIFGTLRRGLGSRAQGFGVPQPQTGIEQDADPRP